MKQALVLGLLVSVSIFFLCSYLSNMEEADWKQTPDGECLPVVLYPLIAPDSETGAILFRQERYDQMRLTRAGALQSKIPFACLTLKEVSESTGEWSAKQKSRAVRIAILVLLLTLSGLGVWVLIQIRKGRQSQSPHVEKEKQMQKENILDQIITLDDRFQAGDLGAEVYHARRCKLVKQVKDLENKR